VRTLAATALLTLAGSGIPAADPPAWLLEGERLTYELSYLRLKSGTLTLEASQVPGEPTVRLASRAVSSPFVSRFARVDEQLESILDPRLGTVLWSRRQTLDDGEYREELVLFDPEQGTARRFKGGTERQALAAPPPVLDTLASIFWLRTLPLTAGSEFRLTVQSGGRVYPLVVSVGGATRLRTASGVQRVLPVVPRYREGGMLRQKGTLRLLVADDPWHTPLRITSELTFGSLTATLHSVERPWSPVVESTGSSERHGRESDGPQTR